MPFVINTHFHNPYMYMIITFVVASELQISAYCNKIGCNRSVDNFLEVGVGGGGAERPHM